MIPDWEFGDLPETVGLPASYFRSRGILLDCRGPLVIDARSYWGFLVMVITQSHRISRGRKEGIKNYGVRVDEGAWIASGVLLTGCHIGAGAIICAGSVVRGQTVAPGVMVAGNPARVIARWRGSDWWYLPSNQSGFERMLA